MLKCTDLIYFKSLYLLAIIKRSQLNIELKFWKFFNANVKKSYKRHSLALSQTPMIDYRLHHRPHHRQVNCKTGPEKCKLPVHALLPAFVNLFTHLLIAYCRCRLTDCCSGGSNPTDGVPEMGTAPWPYWWPACCIRHWKKNGFFSEEVEELCRAWCEF